MSEKLKPCPFCGAEARVWVTDDARFVPLCYVHGQRQTCQLRFASYTTVQEAVEAWNTRVEPEPGPATTRVLERAAEAIRDRISHPSSMLTVTFVVSKSTAEVFLSEREGS